MRHASSHRAGRARVCVVGPGTRFLSGITYYTFALSNALADVAEVSAVLMRRLLPERLYPGRERVGTEIAKLDLDPRVRRFDGVDWFWLPSLLRAAAFLLRTRPSHLVLQWWTGTTLHTYLALAAIARCLGARVVIEFHETQDVGEARHRFATRYVSALAPLLFRQASHYVAHSEHERSAISEHYAIDGAEIAVIPHATYAHYRGGACRHEHDDCNLLFFGIVRPFKGLEDLVRAFELLADENPSRYRLTIVGETWEGWSLPAELIAASRHADRITFVNRYVSDDEVDAAFADADLVVLPYHRSNQSGPLHVAMNYGLPVVVTAVGGLIESVQEYEGAVLVEPGEPAALAAAIDRAQPLVGRRFADPRGWDQTARRYLDLFAAGPRPSATDAPRAPVGGR
jgi:glycosyltransferase involved in cell wall biosynthesis